MVLLIFYIPYNRCPEKHWRDQVFGLVATARRRLASEKNALQNLAAMQQEEKRNLRDKAFNDYLRSYSVKELEEYSGIGPVTVSNLQNGGYTNLAALQGARIRIYGFGKKRLADIAYAVRELTRMAHSRFEAGACPQANQLAAMLRAMEDRYKQLHWQARARVKGAKFILDKLESLAGFAQQVTFSNFLRRDWNELVPPEILNNPLPDLEGTIQTAEEKAVKIYHEKIPVATPAAETPENQHPTPPSLGTPSPALSRTRQTRDVLPVKLLVPPPEKVVPSPVHEENPKSGIVPKAPATTSPLPKITPDSTPPKELKTANRDSGYLAIIELSIQFAFAVARADGVVSPSEKETIVEHYKRRYGYDSALRNRALAFCAQYEKSAIDLDVCIKQIRSLFTVDHRKSLFQFGQEIWAGSGAGKNETPVFLEYLARRLDVPYAPSPVKDQPPTKKSAHKKPFPSERKEGIPLTRRELEILKIDPATPLSPDLVRRQFHLLLDRYNPEKFQSMGPEFLAIVKRNRNEVIAAAKALWEQLGEKGEIDPPPSPPSGLRDNPDLDTVFGD